MNAQSFTCEYADIVPRLITECGVCEAYIDVPGGKHPKGFKVRALWDTGATCTTISKNVVKGLGLTPIGFGDVFHAGGSGMAGVYKINVLLPNNIEFPALKVLDGDLYGFDMLIGMDIISKGDFAVTHSDGKTTFTFRIPSMEKLDFVDSSPKAASPITAPKKVGRNEPCPCGSGKKYKQCCGK